LGGWVGCLEELAQIDKDLAEDVYEGLADVRLAVVEGQELLREEENS
jgi:hypothetical protein